MLKSCMSLRDCPYCRAVLTRSQPFQVTNSTCRPMRPTRTEHTIYNTSAHLARLHLWGTQARRIPQCQLIARIAFTGELVQLLRIIKEKTVLWALSTASFRTMSARLFRIVVGELRIQAGCFQSGLKESQAGKLWPVSALPCARGGQAAKEEARDLRQSLRLRPRCKGMSWNV